MLAYERLQTLGSLFTCHRKLSFVPHKIMDEGISGLCGKCALCGNYDSLNFMVPMIKRIHTFNEECHLTQKSGCKNHGIYASCCNCNIGQTVIAFAQRWTKHRKLWYRFWYSESNDSALLDIMANISKQFLLASLM